MLISDFAKLNRLTQSSVFVALIVIAVVAMYKWIVTPHINCLFAAEQYDSAMDGVAQKNEDIVREIKVESKKLEKLSQQFVQCGDKLFTPDQAKELFSALQAILEDAGCTVHSLNLVASKSRDKNKQPDGAAGIAANSMMLSVSGGYTSIIRLIEGLQNHTPKVWVDSFEMELVDFGSGRLKCDMTITIYMIQSKEAVLWINAGT